MNKFFFLISFFLISFSFVFAYPSHISIQGIEISTETTVSNPFISCSFVNVQGLCILTKQNIIYDSCGVCEYCNTNSALFGSNRCSANLCSSLGDCTYVSNSCVPDPDVCSSSFCGNNEIDVGEECGEPGLNCDEGVVCINCVCGQVSNTCEPTQELCGDETCCEIGGCKVKNICEDEACISETVTTCNPTNECVFGSNDCVIPDPDPNPGICGDRARTYLYAVNLWPVDSVYCLKGLPTVEPNFPEVGESVSWNCIFEEESSGLCTARRLNENEDFSEREDGTFNSIVDFTANYVDGKLELYTQCLISDLGKLSIPLKEINDEALGCGVTKELISTKEIEIEPGIIELNFKIKEPCEVCERTIYLNIKQASEKNVSIPDFNFVSILLIILTVIFVLKSEKK